MPSPVQSAESTDATTQDLLVFLSRVPLFQAVEPASGEQRRLWRACELCTFIEYRFDDTPDPRELSDDQIDAWSKRGLSDGERLSEPGETDWLWQPAVRFYLGIGYWVQNWKRSLCLVRWPEYPAYAITAVGDGLELQLQGHLDPLIRVHRVGSRLIWDERPGFQELQAEDAWVCWPLRSTFALQLAVAGWPLIRGPEEWE